MYKSVQHYIGDIDCFGIKSEQREAWMQKWWNYFSQSGGDMQVQALENLLDTDRYKLHISASACSGEAIFKMLEELCEKLPDDHPPMIIESFNHADLVKEDLIVKNQAIFIQTYSHKPDKLLQYSPKAKELSYT